MLGPDDVSAGITVVHPCTPWIRCTTAATNPFGRPKFDPRCGSFRRPADFHVTFRQKPETGEIGPPAMWLSIWTKGSATTASLAKRWGFRKSVRSTPSRRSRGERSPAPRSCRNVEKQTAGQRFGPLACGFPVELTVMFTVSSVSVCTPRVLRLQGRVSSETPADLLITSRCSPLSRAR